MRRHRDCSRTCPSAGGSLESGDLEPIRELSERRGQSHFSRSHRKIGTVPDSSRIGTYLNPWLPIAGSVSKATITHGEIGAGCIAVALARRFVETLADGAAAGLVPRTPARSALAANDRSLPDLDQRDHAATDPGRDGHPLFRTVRGQIPDGCRFGPADESEVLRHWEGLGYYRRARQLHRAARQIVERHGGEFPRSLDDVGQLPGIGRYTAGAITSIAFDEAAPIVEANTVRLFSRLIGFRDDPTSTAGRRQMLWQVAEAIVPARGCGTFNQALMELGSLVCTPRNPGCDHCPVATLCVANRRGLQAQVPRMPAKAASEAVREAAVIVWHKNTILLRRREAGERWAGLWDFLRFPLAARRGAASARNFWTKSNGTPALRSRRQGVSPRSNTA